MLAGHLGNFLLTIVPEKYKFLITGLISITQWIVSGKAHWSTPDGAQLERIEQPVVRIDEIEAQRDSLQTEAAFREILK